MYNIANHYENIYTFLKTIITDPRVVYLHPFGSTQPENVEMIRDDSLDIDDVDAKADNLTFPGLLPTDEEMCKRYLALQSIRGPLFLFYDQEPLDLQYNYPLFKYIIENTRAPYVLVSTERDSYDKDMICRDLPFAEVNYFFHIFAAADWFRGHEYLPGLVAPAERQLTKSYISFNRITSNKRLYRSLLVNELYKNDLLDHGYVSYSKVCPDTNDSFDVSIREGIAEYPLGHALKEEVIANIQQLPELRIDFAEDEYIPNQSMLLSPMRQLMESFVFLVTETCYFQNKTHLTEKIFKPIVLKMPFVLVGCANNLAYLRSYGFKTFGDFWDESYDTIFDPMERLKAIVKILKDISTMSVAEQQAMLVKMQPILDHNYNLFNDPAFVRQEWDHLKEQLRLMCRNYEFRAPYTPNPRLGQAIPVDPI
jgi:hypothetical protein